MRGEWLVDGYQSPCGDSFHFNLLIVVLVGGCGSVSIPLRGFFSFQPGTKVPGACQVLPPYQSPCGDSFHFNMSLHLAVRFLAGCINPLAGILFISTLRPGRGNPAGRRVSIPLRGFFSFQQDWASVTSLNAGLKVVSIPLRGFFSFQPDAAERCQGLRDEQVSIPLRGFFSFQRGPSLRGRWRSGRYQSPCGDSFHFNEEQMKKYYLGYSVVSIPLRGFFSFQQVVESANAQFAVNEYQSPCGDSFHFNQGMKETLLDWRDTGINPLAGILFISTQSRANRHRDRSPSINPLAGILFISTISGLASRYFERNRVSIPLRGFFSFQHS